MPERLKRESRAVSRLSDSELTDIRSARTALSLHVALHFGGETPKYRRSKTIDQLQRDAQVGTAAPGPLAIDPRITAENFALCYDLMNASRSALIWSLLIVHMPCDSPG